MIRCHCERFAPHASLENFNHLYESGWLERKTGRSQYVQHIIEEQLTNTCGQRFREKANGPQKQEYIDAVQSWARPSTALTQKRVALYLIYHTVPSKGIHKNRRIDTRLWPPLQQLATDPDRQVKKLMQPDHISSWYANQKRRQ